MPTPSSTPSSSLSSSSASARLRQLCLAGRAVGPVPAVAGKRAPPRCVPEPPSVQLEVGAPAVVSMPGEVRAVVVGADGVRWAFGTDGRAWSQTYGPWKPVTVGAPGPLVAAASGSRSWVVGDEGAVFSYQGASGWVPAALPWGARGEQGLPDLTAVASVGPTVAVAGEGGALFLSDDGGSSWTAATLGGASEGTVRALAVAHEVATVALGDGTLVSLRAEGGGWTAGAPRPAPGGLVTDLLYVGPEQLLAIDASGDAWASPDGGASWATDRADHVEDPLSYLALTAMGPTAVHRSGRAAAFDVHGPRPTLGEGQPLDSAARPGGEVQVVSGSGRSDGELLLSVTDDGRMVVQSIRMQMRGGHPCGRPLQVAGEPVLAPAVVAAGWAARAPAVDEGPTCREELAAAWLRDARAEHASVASFARFVLRLLALGASAALVDDAQQAMADEVRHAKRCFGLASRYAEQPLAPGPLPLAGVFDEATDLVQVSVEVLREGAVGETLAALLAEAMRDRATDAEVRDVLGEIAADEARHAQAAWRFLAWAVAEGGAPVRAALADALDDALAQAWTGSPRPAPRDLAAWHAHGRLAPDEERWVVRRALRSVVRPCAAVLLQGPSAPAG